MEKLNLNLISIFKATFAIILLVVLNKSFSQETTSSNNNFKENIAVSTGKNIDLSATTQLQYSAQETKIISEMKNLKEQNISGNSEKILQLQKQLETINGSSITKQEESFGSVQTSFTKNNNQTDNFSLTQIYSGTLVKGIASQVEQKYSGAGTIWVAVAAGYPDTGVAAEADSLIVYRSLDNTGTSYSEFSRIAIGAANKFYPEDAIDMEIIELNDFTTFVYIVYNYTTNGYNGKQKVGCAVVRDNPYLVNNFTLDFPGSSSPGNNYLRPRITSDIATYYASPFITIALIQDSTVGSNHYYLTKYCRIINPFTTSPAISFLPQSLYIAGASPYDAAFTVQADVAYVSTSGTPSNKIVFTLSGYPQLGSHIYVYKTDATLVNYSYWSYQFDVFSNKEIQLMRTASNGGPGQSKVRAIFSIDYYNNGNWKIGIIESDVADLNDFWGGGVYLYPLGSFLNGDIVGRRNAPGSFTYAYKNVFGCEFANNAYQMSVDGVSNKRISSLNYEYSNSHAAPKPVFRYVNNDSCLAISTGYYHVNARAGSSAPLVLDLKLNIEGLYNAVTDLNNWDNRIYVYLANVNSPHNIVDSATNFICSNDNSGSFVFNNAPEGDYYYVIKHRNSVETWTSDAVHLNTNTDVFFDFTVAGSAYENNVKHVNSNPDRFALFSGDVNQDGFIDLTDVLLIYNDASNFVTGNVETDLTGEYIVDLSDVTIAFNNSADFVSVKKP